MFVFFDALDSAFTFLPLAFRAAVYGSAVGILAMLIYWRISPQARIAQVKLEMASSRKALRAYTGTDFRHILRLCRQTLAPALRQLLLVLGPTLIATAPVIIVLAWMESAFTYRLPLPGETVPVRVAGDVTRFDPADAVVENTEGYTLLRWPQASRPVHVIESHSDERIFTIPPLRPTPTITKARGWDTLLYGDTMASLPAHSKVSRIDIDLPRRQVWTVGPAWLRSWHTPCLIALALATLVMKFIFRIH